jgi:hypothetical protein
MISVHEAGLQSKLQSPLCVNPGTFTAHSVSLAAQASVTRESKMPTLTIIMLDREEPDNGEDSYLHGMKTWEVFQELWWWLASTLIACPIRT